MKCTNIFEEELILTTIAPPPKKTAIFFNERFVTARYEEGCHEKYIYIYIFTFILVREGLSTDDVGVGQRAPCFRRYGRGLVSKPAISLEKSWGGYRSKTKTRSFFFRVMMILRSSMLGA